MRPTPPSATLSVQQMSVAFRTRLGIVQVLDRISFDLARGETLALVGESGSGKSVAAYAVMGLLDAAGRITNGAVLLDGTDMATASPRDQAAMRGKRAAMIFQNPRAALNPIRTVGKQIADVLRRHEGLRGRAAAARAIELLAAVGITDPKRRAGAYPFELSGGMCQRVMIAIAIATKPALLIADEPTTGLDVTTQAVVMDLVQELGAEHGMATLLITHDLALAADRADRIAVMHAGHIVEQGAARALLAAPRHPYTQGLLAATPTAAGTLDDLHSVPGALPDLRRTDLPACRYAERCPRRIAACDQPLTPREIAPAHALACWNPA